MITSRIVMPRGRVSMNVTTLATSLASSRLPDSLASFSFSGGQSASSALMTGPGETEPTRMPCLNTWRRTVSGGKEATPCRIDGDYIGSRINPQRRHQAYRASLVVALCGHDIVGNDPRSPLEFHLCGGLGCRGGGLALVPVRLCRTHFQALNERNRCSSSP